MKQVKIITAQEAAQLVKDGDVVTTNGFVGSGQPEALTSALEERFLNTGSPRDLTLIYAASQGRRRPLRPRRDAEKSHPRPLERRYGPAEISQ